MAKLAGNYKNVFDDQNEFDKLNDFILEGIQKFTDYRGGNVTFGEIMFVMESILDSMRSSSESDAKTYRIKGLKDTPTFTKLYSITGRAVEIMVKKGIINSSEESFILHGEEK